MHLTNAEVNKEKKREGRKEKGERKEESEGLFKIFNLASIN